MRLPDWPKQLSAAIDSARTSPFQWGAHDCCTFAASCALAVSGADLFPGIKWTDEKSALKAIKKSGGFAAHFDATLSRLDNPLFMQRGDIGLIDNRGRLTVVVCAGPSVVSPGENGLESSPITSVLHAWRIE